MKRDLGFGYCGLACCVCSENPTCPGCQSNGCKGKYNCTHYACCREKGLTGCWTCSEYPCGGEMFLKPRVRTFVSLLRENGPDMLMDCLERNERAGVRYHDPGKLTGDYDRPETEEARRRLILTGTVD